VSVAVVLEVSAGSAVEYMDSVQKVTHNRSICCLVLKRGQVSSKSKSPRRSEKNKIVRIRGRSWTCNPSTPPPTPRRVHSTTAIAMARKVTPLYLPLHNSPVEISPTTHTPRISPTKTNTAQPISKKNPHDMNPPWKWMQTTVLTALVVLTCCT
jgi:hypothetical protein